MAHGDLGWAGAKKDVEIIKECAAKNYTILSGDKSMSRVPEERQAIIDGKCKVFMFEDSHKTRTEDWVASVLVGRERILDIIRKTNGPLFVTIKPSRSIGHIGYPDFIEKAGGGWRIDEKATLAPVIEVEHPKQREHKPQQNRFEFPKGK